MANDIVFFALADPTRRSLLERLKDGPASVTALAAGMPVTRPAVSQHLKVLKAAGLVADQADGARRVYRIDWSGLHRLRVYIDSFWEAEMQRQLEERRHG